MSSIKDLQEPEVNLQIIEGDCLEHLKSLESNSVDSVVTDPPYGLSNTKPAQVADVLAAWVTGDTEAVPSTKGGFMGKDWDSFVPPPAVWAECLRVLKPGGHMAVFAGARTQDLMGLSIRLAGFEIRDTLGWIYGSGFPKSMDVSKAIDKERREDAEPVKAVAKALRAALDASGKTRKEIDAHFGTANVSQYWFSPHRNSQVPPVDKWPWLRDFLGIDSSLDDEVWRLNGRKGTPGEAWEKREVVGAKRVNGAEGSAGGFANGIASQRGLATGAREVNITAPATPEAQRWDGWGTSLKPAIEPIILARKPLVGTVAQNVLEHGVGGLNIDACRVPSDEVTGWGGAGAGGGTWNSENMRLGKAGEARPVQGRFPANVLLDEHAATEMDRQSGWSPSNARKRKTIEGKVGGSGEFLGALKGTGAGYALSDSGGASRFFPVFKYQAKAPKRERPVIEREDGSKIQHPTVKPEKLMEWLVTLTTPEGGLVLDPFAGSGTTLQAARNKGFRAIGIEQDPDYIQLIHTRLINAGIHEFSPAGE